LGRDLRLLIVGFGSVGQALAHQLQIRREEPRGGEGRILVVGIADSTSSVYSSDGVDVSLAINLKKETGAVGKKGSRSSIELVREADADVLVELASAGGQDGEPGLSRIIQALDHGMDVVTSNKMPLAVAYSSLLGRARSKKRMIKYGACVGAGIPVFEFADACMASDRVEKVEGVLNATSNFILTKMEQHGVGLNEALREAQNAGYAEADPSLDLRGVDAAAKAVILGNHVLGRSFALKDVKELVGIGGVTQDRIGAAKTRGVKVRMIASVDKVPRVNLAELPMGDPLAVDGAGHAVKFRCAASGDRYVGGEGAGGLKTSLAVFRDILAVKASAAGRG
jgi:homoserine dehydrogenase